MGAPPRQRVRVSGERSGDGARTTGNEGRRTTDCRGARRRGLAFGLTARAGAHGRPASAPPRTGVWGGATVRDTQADVPSAEWLRAQLAFKNSMIRGILQFTPSIAFRYVLHRCESLDIRCRESFWIISKDADAGGAPCPGPPAWLSWFRFPWRVPRRGSVCGRETPGPRPQRGGEGATSAPRPPSVVTGSRVVLLCRFRQ